ncbi:MAG TPA: choice-of-anchor D domain-containing protein, partial [Terriglobales bacterium]|nr:choice-of-anchor D domain-containing protein [Terriglobales bacterium]
PANLTGTVTCSTTATSTSLVSGNPYSSSCSGATSTNYAINYVSGVVTINQATTTTTITSNVPNPSIRGQIVTINFKVAPQFSGTPTGTVRVDASTGESCAATLPTASCNLIFSTAGSRTLTATYSGDSNFLPSISPAATQQVVSSVTLSSTSLLFGNQVVGTNSASQAITLANVGTTTLTINSILIGGANPADFIQSSNCGGTLRAGQNCRINVTFRPTAVGPRTATLSINDSDVTSPQTVSLSGMGVQAAATLTPTYYNFGTVARRQTASFGFTLSNTGTAPLTIFRVSLGGANSNQYTQSNNCGTSLGAGLSCTITVTFVPNQRGTLNATLSVSDNAVGSPHTATLTGVGQ